MTQRAGTHRPAGYALDNSGRLVDGRVATLPAFALEVSLYDRALAGAVGTADPDVPVLLRAPAPAAQVAVTRSRWPWRRPAPLVVAADGTGPEGLARLVGAARAGRWWSQRTCSH